MKKRMKQLIVAVAGYAICGNYALAEDAAAAASLGKPDCTAELKEEPSCERHAANEMIPERRRSQVQTEPGYIASPVAVNIPGVGFSYGLIGSFFNIAETEGDIFGFTTRGDTNGFGLGLIDVPLYSDLISFNSFLSKFGETSFESHRRGINSDVDDRRILKLQDTNVLVTQLSLKLFDKRVQFYSGIIQRKSTLDEILNKDGEVIAEPDAESETSVSRSAGVLVDLTDDRSDARRGLRYEFQGFLPAEQSEFYSSHYIVDHNFTYYVPVGNLDTLVLNAYRSDSIIRSEGELDKDVIREEQGLNCAFLPEVARDSCVEEENERVEETYANNKYGTSSSLGGTSRMRSYVTGRFKAAHAQTFGWEYRWNITEEFTPFDIYLAKGVRTGIQIALFNEWGTVSDKESELSDASTYKAAYGLGIRALVASGFIVRLDVAKGDEGIQPTLFFNYPWFVF